MSVSYAADASQRRTKLIVGAVIAILVASALAYFAVASKASSAGPMVGTNTKGTNSTGTNSTGTNSTGTNSTGTNSTGTNSTGTNSTGTNSTSGGS